MNKRQAKKGANPRGYWRRTKREWWYETYSVPRWRQRVKWVKKQWSFGN